MIGLYAQGSATGGLGHLSRTIALGHYLDAKERRNMLFADVDDYARRWLEERNVRFLPSEDICKHSPSDVIIDTISTNLEIKNCLSTANRRIVISPTCKIFDIATHVFVRELGEFCKNIRPTAVVLENEYFAFFSDEPDGVEKQYCSDPLTLGVVLSGGINEDHLVDKLITCLAKTNTVGKIIYVGAPINVAQELPIEFRRLNLVNSSQDLWKELSGIDIFVGRQGLMLFEAIGKGIPVFSILLEGEEPKNRTFASKGLLTQIDANDLGFSCLSRMLVENVWLQDFKHRVVEYAQRLEKNLLFRQVFDLIEGE